MEKSCAQILVCDGIIVDCVLYVGSCSVGSDHIEHF